MVMMCGKKTLFIAAGTLVLCGWGAPSRLFASCGDYVMPQAHQEAKPSATQSSPSQEQEVPQQPAPRKRCPGPNCSSHQDVPIAPPAPPAPTSVKEAVAWLNLALLFDRNGHNLAQDNDLILSQGPGLDIFHPPRA